MHEFSTTAILLVTVGALLAVSALWSRAVDRLGVPIVLLFLVVGMLGGSEGLGGLAFDDYRLSFRLGTVALILILFDGGFNTRLRDVRDAGGAAGVLATLGVLATAGLVAGFARLLGLAWPQALVLGAVVSSTDAAAVFAVLRGAGIRLPRRLATTLEVESGLNDPMAVILTLAATTALADGEQASLSGLLLSVPLQLIVGAAVGVSCGAAGGTALRRVQLSTGGMYAVLTLSVAFVSFGAATLLNGSGFLAVYATAIYLGNVDLPYRNGLTRIHDALAWLCQVGMFVMLGLLVFPSQLAAVASVGLALGLFLAVIARPLAVWLCLLPFRFTRAETLFTGWVGLRGAVPIVLATFPVLSEAPGALDVFNIVFFVVVVNAFIPGATIRPLARRLGFELAGPPSPAAALEINSTRLLKGQLLSFHVTPSIAVCDATLAEIPFPPDSAAILVVRGESLLAARGATRLSPGDHVYVFCRPEDRPLVELLFGRPHDDGQ